MMQHLRHRHVINQILWSSTVLAAEQNSELMCDLLRYVKAVQLSVQQLRQTGSNLWIPVRMRAAALRTL